MDVFRPTARRGAPLWFSSRGYWRRRTPLVQPHGARLNAHGIAVAVPGYDCARMCGSATSSTGCAPPSGRSAARLTARGDGQLRRRAPHRLHGGEDWRSLDRRCRRTSWARRCHSGIFDLKPLLSTYVNRRPDDEAEAERLSPRSGRARGPHLRPVVGATRAPSTCAEPHHRAVWGAAGSRPLRARPGANPFTHRAARRPAVGDERRLAELALADRLGGLRALGGVA